MENLFGSLSIQHKGWLAAKVKAYADNQIHKADVCKQVRREATVEFDEPDASP